MTPNQDNAELLARLRKVIADVEPPIPENSHEALDKADWKYRAGLHIGWQKARDAVDRAAPRLNSEKGSPLEIAARGLLKHMSSTYKARNGREMGIEADDGEKCWIVHSDYIAALQGAIEALSSPPVDREAVPEGFVLVPRVPTEAMLFAGKSMVASIGSETLRNAYAAMLSAAPVVSGVRGDVDDIGAAGIELFDPP